MVVPDLAQHGGLSGAIGADDGHLFVCADGKGDLLQQLLFKGQVVVLYLQQHLGLLTLFGGGDLGQTDIGLADCHKRLFDFAGLPTLQISYLGLEDTALQRIHHLGCFLAQALHHFVGALHLGGPYGGGLLQFDLFLEQIEVVLQEIALKFLQVGVFQMPDLVEAVSQQIAAVGDHQQSTLVGVDQIPQTVQVLEIQKDIRLVHDQQAGAAQHLTDDLNQLIFTAGQVGQLQIGLVFQLGQLQLAADIDFVVIRVHGFALVQQLLVALQQGVQVFGGFHLGADGTDGLLQMQEILAEIVEDGGGLGLVPAGKLADIADAAYVFPDEFSGEQIVVRVADQVGQSGFAGAVAADQGAMAAIFQSKGDFFV